MATLEELQTELSEFKAARRAVLIGGQEFDAPGGRSTTRADLETLNKHIAELELRISMLQRNGCLSHSTAVFGVRG
jgi:hypothetical protein